MQGSRLVSSFSFIHNQVLRQTVHVSFSIYLLETTQGSPCLFSLHLRKLTPLPRFPPPGSHVYTRILLLNVRLHDVYLFISHQFH